MNRAQFHKLFKTPGPVVLPVIHVTSAEQTVRNLQVAIGEGAPGVFLINHDFGPPGFLPIIRHAREKFPSLWLGVNFLAVTGREAFPMLAELHRQGVEVDGYWADDARIDERGEGQSEAEQILRVKSQCGWNGFYTGGVCFKKQREVPAALHELAARIAASYMDAVCTSGAATGKAADLAKIQAFRRAIGDRPLTLASGVTPENAPHYARDVDGFMVATGVNREGDFYNLDPAKLARLIRLTRDYGAQS